MVSLDVYRNRDFPVRRRDPAGAFSIAEPHYDFAFRAIGDPGLGALFIAGCWPPADDAQREWQTLLRLVGIVSGMGPAADTTFLDTMVMTQVIQREMQSEASSVHGREVEDILAALEPRVGPERMADFMLRSGPYGDGFGANPDGLTLDKVIAEGGAVNLGAMKSRVPEVLRTPTGKIELAPEQLLADIARLRASEPVNGGKLLLIGRRHLRSNNSWMHNVSSLVSGKNRCTLQIHPDDAADRGLADGALARVASRVGVVEASVEILGRHRAPVSSACPTAGDTVPATRRCKSRRITPG